MPEQRLRLQRNEEALIWNHRWRCCGAHQWPASSFNRQWEAAQEVLRLLCFLIVNQLNKPLELQINRPVFPFQLSSSPLCHTPKKEMVNRHIWITSGRRKLLWVWRFWKGGLMVKESGMGFYWENLTPAWFPSHASRHYLESLFFCPWSHLGMDRFNEVFLVIIFFRRKPTARGSWEEVNGNQEGTLPAFSVSIHLHVPGVDGGINHNPRATPQLGLGRNINHHRLGALPQAVHDVSTKLQHLIIHVCREWDKLEIMKLIFPKVVLPNIVHPMVYVEKYIVTAYFASKRGCLLPEVTGSRYLMSCVATLKTKGIDISTSILLKTLEDLPKYKRELHCFS